MYPPAIMPTHFSTTQAAMHEYTAKQASLTSIVPATSMPDVLPELFPPDLTPHILVFSALRPKTARMHP